MELARRLSSGFREVAHQVKRSGKTPAVVRRSPFGWSTSSPS